jgi:hypothetical protein
MEVVNKVTNLFAQASQQSVLREIFRLTRGTNVWMQQGFVSHVILPTPSQMVRHFCRRFRLRQGLHLSPSAILLVEPLANGSVHGVPGMRICATVHCVHRVLIAKRAI